MAGWGGSVASSGSWPSGERGWRPDFGRGINKGINKGINRGLPTGIGLDFEAGINKDWAEYK